MNYIVKLFFEMYVDFFKNEALDSERKMPVNIYDIDTDYLFNYTKYAILLMYSSMHPYFVEMLLMNARDSILRKCSENQRDLLGLQMLYVIQSVKIIWFSDLKDYYHFSENIVTPKFDLLDMYNYIYNSN